MRKQPWPSIPGHFDIKQKAFVPKEINMNLLDACKHAYRKHHLGDDSIGWEELSDCLLDALCNEMGDEGFQEWLTSFTNQKGE